MYTLGMGAVYLLGAATMAAGMMRRFPARRRFCLLWAGLTVCWIPAYLALFPGTFGYDVPVQVAQFFHLDGYSLNAANPVLHTCLIGVFLAVGEKVLGSYTAGYAAFIAFQALMVSGAGARALAYLKRKGVPVPVIALGAAWLALHPAIQALAMNGTKDVLFGVCLLHFVIDYWQHLSDEGEHPVRLALTGALVCLMRNAGLYILVALLAGHWIFRIRKRAMHRSLMAAVLVSVVFSAFCTYGLHLPRSDSRENFSLPIQQMGYVCNQYLSGNAPDNMTPEQYETLLELVSDTKPLYEFSTFTADPLKSVFRTDVCFSNPMRYLKLYVELGLQNPVQYLTATWEMIKPYWNMRRGMATGLILQWTFEEINFCGIERHCLLEPYRTYLERTFYYNGQPWAMGVTGAGMWLLTLLPLDLLIRRNKRFTLGYLPMFVYALGILFGPVALMRYLFPIMLATPLMVGMLFAPGYLTHLSRNCTYHIVFAPKHGSEVRFAERRTEIEKILKMLCEWKRVDIIEAEVGEDRAHLLAKVPSKLPVSNLIEYLKRESSLMICQKNPKCSDACRSCALWSRGCYVATAGERDREIEAYIGRQLDEARSEAQEGEETA